MVLGTQASSDLWGSTSHVFVTFRDPENCQDYVIFREENCFYFLKFDSFFCVEKRSSSKNIIGWFLFVVAWLAADKQRRENIMLIAVSSLNVFSGFPFTYFIRWANFHTARFVQTLQLRATISLFDDFWTACSLPPCSLKFNRVTWPSLLGNSIVFKIMGISSSYERNIV